ncbi:hypothetical protein [Ectopseudomonas hydrolytica]|uniref:hypothetical protein n=1 Tax=Ectopseudomonas hydrolytica TaxID=2493633 RepID=UPI00376EF545
MSNFKVGDLALVVGSDYPENNGCEVELIAYVKHGSTISSVRTEQDFHNVSGKSLWYVVGRVGNPKLQLAGESFFEASQLMPLRGDFQPERQKSQEVPA